jgi:uncharacterized protein
MPRYCCPTCGKSIQVLDRDDAPHRPFCSPRCQWIDLSKWFAGEYRISEPLTAPELPEEPPDPPPD